VDGGWGFWSTWFQCDYTSNPDKRVFDSNCQCRKRPCDKPEPTNGGLECNGRGLEVTNCARHGGWTGWSDWSGCSQSCDIGIRHRRRSCGNPSPAFGGQICVGLDVDNQYCSDLLPCTAVNSKSVTLVKDDDQLWGQWSAWSKCSADCDRGFRSRTRMCFSGQGTCDGGCAKEFEECEEKKCSDLMEVTDWTPWLRSNQSVDGGSWYEKRFRFTYQSPVSMSEVGKVHSEERFCHGLNSCTTTTSLRTQTEIDTWSDWSKCSRECGGGYQIKLRSCSEVNCFGGHSVVQRACNTQPCVGQWGCWSAWSSCDGHGLKKHRTRHCLSSEGVVNGDRTSPLCEAGSSYEEMPCDGWGPWTSWSSCDLATDSRSKSRTCLTNACDEGLDMEHQTCSGLPPRPVPRSFNLMAVACICSFVVGAGLGAGLVFYFSKVRSLGSSDNVSPHYVSAKSQNLYVSLPMLDLKHKHMSSNQSECGTMRSTSTLRSKAGSSVYNGGCSADYETATIKRSQRNSSMIAGSSNVMHVNLDSDQIFT
jgi:semaphorin 5